MNTKHNPRIKTHCKVQQAHCTAPKKPSAASWALGEAATAWNSRLAASMSIPARRRPLLRGGLCQRCANTARSLLQANIVINKHHGHGSPYTRQRQHATYPQTSQAYTTQQSTPHRWWYHHTRTHGTYKKHTNRNECVKIESGFHAPHLKVCPSKQHWLASYRYGAVWNRMLDPGADIMGCTS